MNTRKKVAKVKIEYIHCDGYWWECKFARYEHWQSGFVKSRSSAIRGARRFCKQIGFEMEVVK